MIVVIVLFIMILGDWSLLLLSYIITASIELSLVIQSFQTISGSFAWSFGFLFFISIASIPVETSKTGKLIRQEFKKIGINTSLFDFVSNILKVITYLLIISGFLSHIIGLIIAYLIVFMFTIIVFRMYSKIEKED